MSPALTSLDQILATLEPILHDGAYVYCSVPVDTSLPTERVISTFRESEGLTVILGEEEATMLGWRPLYHAAWITLNVHSDLAAVGLTAAFSAALAHRGVSCNVVAGAYHDHLFVPYERRQDAMATLAQLQQVSRARVIP